MRFSDLLDFAWQVIRGNRARTLLILVAMSIGVGRAAAEGAAAGDSVDTLRLGTTPGTIAVGIINWLVDDYRALHPDAVVQIVPVTVSSALDQARRGEVDLLILHHPPTEELIVREGYGTERSMLMYNEFVLLGPPSSDLDLWHESDIAIALTRLAQAAPSFLAPAKPTTAGTKLDELWALAGIAPDWPGYERAGARTAYMLRTAAQFGAYTFVDLGTYVSMKEELKGRLRPQIRDLIPLRNYYSVIPVAAKKTPGARQDLAEAFRDYLVSERGQIRIGTFAVEKYNINLFTPVAHLDDGLRAKRAEQRLRDQERIVNLLVALIVLMLFAAGVVGVLWRRAQRLDAERNVYFHQSMHDRLTGLPTMPLATDRLRLAINGARRHGKKVALLFIDLDGFKAVNDHHGHDAGDHVLMEVAERLQHAIRTEDTAARIGGDEFLAILIDLAHIDEAGRVAQKIIDAIALPVEFSGQTLAVGSSIGIAAFPDHGQDMESLRRVADSAMYRVKQSGKNAFRFAEIEGDVLPAPN